MLRSLYYGTLKKTITAKEIKYMNEFLHETHPNSPVIAIDAAVGDAGDIGLIKIVNNGNPSGAGRKQAPRQSGGYWHHGDRRRKSVFNYSLLNLTRLNLVYRMADIISDALADFAAKTFLPEREVAV